MLFFFICAVSIILSTRCELLPQNICNPRTRDKLGNFLIEQWNLARSKVSLSAYESSSIEHKAIPYLNRFYGANEGVIVYSVNNTLVSYARILKCGNEAIMGNLKIFSRLDGPKNYRGTCLATYTDVIQFKNNFKNHKLDRYKPFQRKPLDYNLLKTYDLPTFTILRDPLLRFESGLTEAAWRTSDYLTNLPDFNGNPFRVNSTENVKEYIHEILNCQINHSLQQIHHIYTQSNVLFTYDINTVGYLDTFKTDWKQTIAPLYHLNNTIYTFNSMYGKHPTSANHPTGPNRENDRASADQKAASAGDPNFMRKYYKLLLKQQPEYLEAICHILLVDYICLPRYALPPQCQYLNQTRADAVAMLTAV